MTRPLNVFLPVAEADPDATIARFLDDPGTWLPEPARRAGADHWRVALRGAGLTRDVEISIDDTWRSGAAVWRRIRWTPVAEEGDVLPLEKLLPGFQGDLGVVRHGEELSLVLAGGYEVPASFLGAAADAAGLNRVARKTGTQFLADIRSALAETAAVAS
ncbi:MAG: hypothetical protein R3320_07550 [Nitriliruptorales bacterium]|nr:hypothetical protein [Nitriliruptorales bacterium]